MQSWCCACLVAQSCLTLCDLMDCSPPGSSVHGDSPGKSTGLSCRVLLQGIFPAQRSNPGLLHCRWILYHLTWQPIHTEWMNETNKHGATLCIMIWLWFHTLSLLMTGSVQWKNTSEFRKNKVWILLCHLAS